MVNRVRVAGTARLTQGSHMVDIHTEQDFTGWIHSLISFSRGTAMTARIRLSEQFTATQRSIS